MSERRADSVTDKINKMINNFSSTPSKPSMFRVVDNLRRINPEAYDPQIIAIGPFHRSKPNLQNMEQHKVRYLKQFLERRTDSTQPSVERYVTSIRQVRDEAKNCYAADIQLDEGEFVEMLILDGCFIIEFLYMSIHRDSWNEDDHPIFQYDHIESQLLNDLTVFENQIPFFIIERLFNEIEINDLDNINSLISPLLRNSIFPLQALPVVPNNAHHLLGIVHYNLSSSFEMDSGNSGEILNINSAVELKEAGISFKKSEDNSFFDIKFENKAMIIQEWEISDSTESLFRNLIAYEYYIERRPQKNVTDYVFFMHCLVRSPEDAKLLRQYGIINHILGSDEMVYNVINKLGKYVMTSSQFSYSNIVKRVNEHCGHKRNRWLAILRRNYFNTPWALISVIAAIALLVLTIIQAAFAILSYRPDHKNES
ncbi:unnamed protein product [Fraxinus pennsylvanica]|uniref:Uncharacterized protein n=1 Tax=Fraxinus pennsylvanica TaxID=56036 RepID=A0AAD1ZWR7_9LAMI|nr:unnamed protein product [Fraxinus pennsylvanica]